MAAPDRSRTFRIVYPDGDVLHGVQFPSGRCVVDNTHLGLVDAATAIEHLTLLGPGSPARVEWDDEEAPDGDA